MADERLRQLERRYRETRSAEDLQAWLGARARAGELDPERLGLAAALGDVAALAVGGGTPASTLGTLLSGRPAEVWFRVGLAVLRRVPEEPALAGLQDANHELGEWWSEHELELQRLPGWVSARAAQERVDLACDSCLRARDELLEALGGWLLRQPHAPPQVTGWLRATEARLEVAREARTQGVVELFSQWVEILPSAVDVVGPEAQQEGEELLQQLRECADSPSPAWELCYSLSQAWRAANQGGRLPGPIHDRLLRSFVGCEQVYGEQTLLRIAREEVAPWALGTGDPLESEGELSGA